MGSKYRSMLAAKRNQIIEAKVIGLREFIVLFTLG
jgi:hypothetical protein